MLTVLVRDIGSGKIEEELEDDSARTREELEETEGIIDDVDEKNLILKMSSKMS